MSQVSLWSQVKDSTAPKVTVVANNKNCVVIEEVYNAGLFTSGFRKLSDFTVELCLR